MTNLELAQNPNTPQEVLASLATDEYSGVRYGVTRNPNTPQEVLASLATDEDSSVRYGVTQHPKVTEDIILLTKSYEKFSKSPLVELTQ